MESFFKYVKDEEEIVEEVIKQPNLYSFMFFFSCLMRKILFVLGWLHM